MRHWTVALLVVASLIAVARGEAVMLRTDTSKALVPLDEIVSGGPPPDGIPAIDRPAFVSAAAAAAWLVPKEPVLALQVKDDARAYPLQILMWHEIVNDIVGGVPVTVTFCPLCNSGLVFERVVRGTTLNFGTSGKLYKSDLVMYDRQSHSLWAQMEGRAIVGAYAGTRLALIPANTLSFEDWRAMHPTGKVLSRDTGHSRSYGRNPYDSYDQPQLKPFLFRDRPDPRRPPKERVVGVKLGDVARAYPWPVLAERRVVHDRLGDHAVVILYQPGTLSALDDDEIRRSRAVGATAAFSPVLEGRALTFEAAAEGFRDRETGSTWTVLGHAVKGPLTGRRLTPVPTSMPSGSPGPRSIRRRQSTRSHEAGAAAAQSPRRPGAQGNECDRPRHGVATASGLAPLTSYRMAHPDRDIFEDRSLEILSRVDIDVRAAATEIASAIPATHREESQHDPVYTADCGCRAARRTVARHAE